MSRFQVEVDEVDRTGWHLLMRDFDDASIYQTWSSPTLGESEISHIVVRDGAEVVGCCQVEIRAPGPGCLRIADIRWGPICMRRERPYSPDALHRAIEAIKEEYGVRRQCFVRIWPCVRGERKEEARQFLEQAGFVRYRGERPYRTLIVDLSPSVEELRANFLQKWRNCLNRAEKKGLSVTEGTDDELFATFLELLGQMIERKRFRQIASYEAFRRMQKGLPEDLKMQIMICRAGVDPVSAVVYSAIGDTGIYLLGATGANGLESCGSYLLQWRTIQRLKADGMRYYDLGAFNPDLNPGVYHFKRGVAGKEGKEEVFLGQYEGSFRLAGHVARFGIGCQRASRVLAGRRS